MFARLVERSQNKLFTIQGLCLDFFLDYWVKRGFFFVCLFLRERGHAGEGQRGRENTSQAGSQLSAQSPMWGWNSQNCGIMIWAELTEPPRYPSVSFLLMFWDKSLIRYIQFLNIFFHSLGCLSTLQWYPLHKNFFLFLFFFLKHSWQHSVILAYIFF